MRMKMQVFKLNFLVFDFETVTRELTSEGKNAKFSKESSIMSLMLWSSPSVTKISEMYIKISFWSSTQEKIFSSSWFSQVKDCTLESIFSQIPESYFRTSAK